MWKGGVAVWVVVLRVLEGLLGLEGPEMRMQRYAMEQVLTHNFRGCWGSLWGVCGRSFGYDML